MPEDHRDITLMIQKNEIVPSNRKMAVRVATLAQLESEVLSNLNLATDDNYFLSLSAASQQDAVKLTNLDQVGAKAKLQVWLA